MASSASSLHRASMDRLSVNTAGTARKASSLRSLAASASDSPPEQPRSALKRTASSNLTPSTTPSPRQPSSSSSSSARHHRGDVHIPRMKSTPRLVYDKDAEQAPSTGMYWSRAPVYGAIPNRTMRAHSVTAIDNVIWLFGGCDDKESWKDIYCLNVESMQWTHPECLGDTPPPSRAHSATLVANHKIVFIGGGHGSTYYDSVYVLDTLTRRWSRPTIAPGPSPPQRRAHTAVLYENKIWVFGGGNGMMALDDVWTLDVSPLVMTGAMGGGGGLGSGGYHGVYHVGGGFYGPYTPTPSSGKNREGNVTLTWELVETHGIKKPESRGYHTANLVGNIMVIIGGSDGKDSFDELWTLNLDTLIWTQIKTNIPYRRLAHSSTQVGSYLFIFGGHDSTEYTSELVLLNLVSLQYETRPVYGKVPSPRGYHATVLADSRVLLIGGFNGHQSFDDVHILELAANLLSPPPSLPFNCTSFTAMSQSSSPRQSITPVPAPTSSSLPVNDTTNPMNNTNTMTNSISLNATISSSLLTPATSSPLFPITAQVGFLTITQPPVHSTSYYKIGAQNITFGWNFTYLLQQPQLLTIKAICDDTHNTYPVGSISGMTEAGVIPGTATEVIWDLKKYQEENQQLPLGPGNYRLTIWDERGESAAPQPGLMRQFGGLKFGMFVPASYVPLDNWTCAECMPNGSVGSTIAHPAFVGFLVSVLIILLSGFHLLRSSD